MSCMYRNDPVYSSLREVRPESNWTTEDTLLHVVVRTTAGLCTPRFTLHSCSLQILHGIVLHEWPVTCLYLSLRWRDDTLVLLVIISILPSLDIVDMAFNYMDIEDETCRMKTICQAESYAVNHPVAKLAINTLK